MFSFIFILIGLNCFWEINAKMTTVKVNSNTDLQNKLNSLKDGHNGYKTLVVVVFTTTDVDHRTSKDINAALHSYTGTLIKVDIHKVKSLEGHTIDASKLPYIVLKKKLAESKLTEFSKADLEHLLRDI